MTTDLVRGTLDALIVRGRDLRIALSQDSLSAAAELAYRLQQDGARRRGVLLPPKLQRGWLELSEDEREAMGSGVAITLKALVLLEYIELPA